MKAQIGLTLSLNTADDLRTRAAKAGAPIGDLADLCIRLALGRMTDDALKAWALKLPTTRGPLAGGLRRDERAIMGAFERLAKTSPPEVTRYGIAEIAKEAGLRLTDAFWALKSLEARGLTSGAELDEVDRWGRPTQSFWKLIQTEAP